MSSRDPVLPYYSETLERRLGFPRNYPLSGLGIHNVPLYYSPQVALGPCGSGEENLALGWQPICRCGIGPYETEPVSRAARTSVVDDLRAWNREGWMW